MEKDSHDAAAIYQSSIDAYARGDFAVAAVSCERAAHWGHAEAMFTLGAHYLAGKGVPLDSARATGWFIKAAEAGNPKAQCNLAVLLQHGIGVGKDEVSARRWCESAAEAGEADGQHNLGHMLLQGMGGPIDVAAAKVWLSRAASQGHENAKVALQKIGAQIAANEIQISHGDVGSLSREPSHTSVVFEVVD